MLCHGAEPLDLGMILVVPALHLFGATDSGSAAGGCANALVELPRRLHTICSSEKPVSIHDGIGESLFVSLKQFQLLFATTDFQLLRSYPRSGIVRQVHEVSISAHKGPSA